MGERPIHCLGVVIDAVLGQSRGSIAMIRHQFDILILPDVALGQVSELGE